jgi:hypothetical protein
MEERKKRGAIVYGDDINFLQFEFQDEEIENLSTCLKKIKDYTTKEINQNNFQELCDTWYKIIAKFLLHLFLLMSSGF